MIDPEKQKYWRVKWVEALTSGAYKQTTGTLRDSNGFCCLGVLCDITKDEVDGVWEDDRMHIKGEGFGYTFNLPHSVRELVGLSSHGGYISVGKSLAGMNDSGQDFNTIADVIKKEEGDLFGQRLW